jgi:hypothetical protein
LRERSTSDPNTQGRWLKTSGGKSIGSSNALCPVNRPRRIAKNGMLV